MKFIYPLGGGGAVTSFYPIHLYALNKIYLNSKIPLTNPNMPFELIFLSLATIRNGEIIISMKWERLLHILLILIWNTFFYKGKSIHYHPKSPSSSSIDHQLFLSTMIPRNQRFAYSDHHQLSLLAKSPTLQNLLLPQMILKIIQHSQNYSPHRLLN